MNFPFSAVAGQNAFKTALILNAINPTIGGVLVSGPRGSAKSTLARSLADVLPGDAHPFVTLPLGSTEEMLIGSLNLEQVLQTQSLQFKPGLLAKAHQGVLYVDEVNLLNDHLVDLLLDVAASGINQVERDGISHQHPANFILLGTMNPDEGELRPQLQDRFGLAVALSNQYSIEERIEIVKLREAFNLTPEAFCQQYQAAQTELKNDIDMAKAKLAQVQCHDDIRRVIAERCAAANVDGLRADIVWFQAAVAHTALRAYREGSRPEVSMHDVDVVEPLVLLHRRNSASPPDSGSSTPPPFKRPDDRSSGDGSSGTGNHGSAQQMNHTEGAEQDADWGAMAPQSQLTAETMHLDVDSLRSQDQPHVTRSSKLTQ